MDAGALVTRLEQALAPHSGRLLTPALLIDLEAAEHNARAMAARAGNRWRPHVKTLKQAALVRVLLEAGVRSFKCATLPELALVLATIAEAPPQGACDVLLAFPASRPALREALRLAATHPAIEVQLLADSPEHLAELDEGVAAAGARAPVLLDVDTGMRRTGRLAQEWAAALPRLSGLGAVEVAGLHGYEGHLTWARREEAIVGYDALCALASALPRPPRLVVTSGSHTYAHALAHAGLSGGPWTHQVSPGTIVLDDLRTREATEDLGLRQAAFVVSRVVSAPGPGRVTLDAGSKALAPDRPPPNCAVLGWPGLEPLGASEEHLPVRVTSGPAPAVGQLLFLVPAHVCTTVNLHARALLLREGKVRDAPVDAAGHRLWTSD